MRPILVSIIIPCYNVEEYIVECLDSAISQTYRPIEIIAVDNNSSDSTLRLLKEFQKKHPELITILDERTQGASASRNKGMSAANGEWLQFLDADDLLLQNKIEHQINLIRNNKSNIVIASHIHMYLNGREIIAKVNSKDIYKSILRAEAGQTGSNLYRKLNEQPLWDVNLRYSEDTKFTFQYLIASKQEQILFDETPLIIVRERPYGQISTTSLRRNVQDLYKFNKDVITYLKTSFKKYYEKNNQYFNDELYYSIYTIGLIDPDLGFWYIVNDGFKGYMPKFTVDNQISLIHELFIYIFDFRFYFKIRKFIKNILY